MKNIANKFGICQLLLFITLLLVSSLCFSQQNEIAISVLVTDSSMNAVPNTSVSIETQDTVGLAFGFSNEEGAVTLKVNIRDKPYALKVSSFGFKTIRVKLISGKSIYKIVLPKDFKVLSNIKIKGRQRPRIISKGDTLFYPVKDFASPSDRTIGDVLKKIPGIEVLANGTIEFNGKSIGHFYIDGDDVLGPKYNIASNNVQASMVDSIQVISKNQPIKVLQGVEEGRNPAINITLKEDTKLRWIRLADLGIGVPNGYDEKLTGMTFKPQLKTIDKISLNNTGTDVLNEISPLTPNQINDWEERNNATNSLSTNINTPTDIPGNRWMFNNSVMGSGNFFWRKNKNLVYKLNTDYVNQRVKNIENTDNIIYSPLDTFSYDENKSNIINKNLFDIAIAANINSKKSYIDNTLSLTYIDADTHSNLITNQKQFKNKLSLNRFKLTNSFSSLQLINNKILSEFKSNTEINHNPENLLIFPGVEQDILNNGIPYYNSNQSLIYHEFYTSNSFGIKLINHAVRQTYTAGFSYTIEKLQSLLTGENDNHEIIYPGPTYKDKGKLQNINPFIQSEYYWNAERQNLTVALLLRSPINNYNDGLSDTGMRKNNLWFEPSLRYDIKVGKENRFTFNASIKNFSSFIQDLYKGNILSDYRTISSNDLPFKVTRTKQVGIRFNLQKSLKILFGHIGLRYSSQNYDWIMSSIISDKSTTNIALPFANSLQSLNYFAGISKYIFLIKANIEISYNGQFSKAKRLQNNELFPVYLNLNRYGIKFQKKISNIVEVKDEISFQNNNTKLNSTENLISNHRVSEFSNSLHINVFPTNKTVFFCQLENKKIESNSMSQFTFLDAGLRHTFQKPKIDVELSALNLTGLKQFEEYFFRENAVVSNIFNLRPASLMLHCSFTF